MAEVFPFRGVLYNPDIIKNMADIVAPPYDVISPQDQDIYYKQHPNNIIRLILGKSKANDSGQKDIHVRAAGYFSKWMEDKTLVRDMMPAYYFTSVTFELGTETVTRYGIIGSVRLETFDKGIILPHEKTFSKVKSERLNLMQTCHTNFSPIFGLYSDGLGILEKLKEQAGIQKPDTDLIDTNGLRHKLWRITDPQIQSHVNIALKDQRIYIADGHHRYETALNYRQWVKERTPGFDEEHPANFVMMSLSSLKDPGLVIFPAHRLLKDVSAEEYNSLMSKAQAYFDIQSISINGDTNSRLVEFDHALAAHSDKTAIGLFSKYQSAMLIMVMKDGVMVERFGNELPEALRNLDVSVLTQLLMMELLGFDQGRLDDATKINYATSSKSALEMVQREIADMAFVLNPTKIEQVQRVAEEGLIMPRKSTYFFPKVISGQVINILK